MIVINFSYIPTHFFHSRWNLRCHQVQLIERDLVVAIAVISLSPSQFRKAISYTHINANYVKFRNLHQFQKNFPWSIGTKFSIPVLLFILGSFPEVIILRINPGEDRRRMKFGSTTRNLASEGSHTKWRHYDFKNVRHWVLYHPILQVHFTLRRRRRSINLVVQHAFIFAVYQLIYGYLSYRMQSGLTATSLAIVLYLAQRCGIWNESTSFVMAEWEHWSKMVSSAIKSLLVKVNWSCIDQLCTLHHITCPFLLIHSSIPHIEFFRYLLCHFEALSHYQICIPHHKSFVLRSRIQLFVPFQMMVVSIPKDPQY